MRMLRPSKVPTRKAGLLRQSALLGALATLIAGTAAFANPTGMVAGGVSAGGAAPGAPVGTTDMSVDLNASRTILNWSTFNVNSGESFTFNFDNRGDIVLNRVSNANISIDGALRGMVSGAFGGNVWLYSPLGVVFGRNAQVDVGGLLATTSTIPDVDFLDGNLDFTFDGFSAASVTVNPGARITGHGGTLAFIAQTVITQEASGLPALIEGAASDRGATSVLYGGASDFTVRFVQKPSNDLDLLDFVINASTFSTFSSTGGSTDVTPLDLQGVTNAGNVYIAAVNEIGVVNAVINAPGTIVANTAAAGGNGDIILSAGGGIVARAPSAANVFVGNDMDATLGFAIAQRDVIGRATGQVFKSTADLTDTSIFAGRDVDIAAAQLLLVNASGSPVLAADITAGRDVRLTTTSVGPGIVDTDLRDVTAGGSILIDAADDVAARTLTAGGDVRVHAGGVEPGTSISILVASAGDDILLAADAGSIFLGSTTRTGLGPDADTDGSATFDGIDIDVAGNGRVLLVKTLSGDIQLGDFSGLDTMTGGTFARIEAPGSIISNLSGPVRYDVVGAGTFFDLNNASDATLGTVTTGQFASLSVTGNLVANTITTGSWLGATSGGSTNIGVIVSVREVDIQAGGAVTIGSLTSGDYAHIIGASASLGTITAFDWLDVSATGAITATALTAGDDVVVGSSGGAITIGTATTVAGAGPDSGGNGRSIIARGNSVSIGTATALGDVYAIANAGAATVGSATVSDDIYVLATGGSASLTSANLVGGVDGASGSPLIYPISDGSFNETLLAGATIGDTLANGRVVRVASTGASSDALLGNGTGSIVGATNVSVTAGRDAIVSTPGALTVNLLTGARDAIAIGSTLAASPLSVLSATAGRDFTLRAGLATFGTLTGPPSRDIIIDVTAAGFTAPQPLVAGRDVTVSAAGAVTLTPVTAGRDATVSALTLASLGAVTAQTVSVIASDLTLSGTVMANRLTVQSRTGPLRLGGPPGTVTGMLVDQTEFARLLVPDVIFYAGLVAGTARGDLTVLDLAVDPSRVGALSLLAGTNNQVLVTGAVVPTVSGWVLNIGDSTVGSVWRPGRIEVTGSIGAVGGDEQVGFTNARAFARVNMTAAGDILMGSRRFIDVMAGTDAAAINLARNQPSGGRPEAGEADHMFLVAQRLDVSAGGKVVQQNTASTLGQYRGIYLTNSLSGPLTNIVLSIDPPTVVDLSGAFVDHTGRLRIGPTAATAPELTLAAGVPFAANYRFNGCTIGGAGDCLPIGPGLQVKFIIQAYRPDRITAPNLFVVNLERLDEDEVDPVVTGTGNEEIWRKRP